MSSNDGGEAPQKVLSERRLVRGGELDYGVFTVSLDFELYWGVRDKLDLGRYRANLLGVQDAVPQILTLFERYQIHSTWAAVGFLFFDDADALQRHTPALLPSYDDASLSPYRDLHGAARAEPDCHFAPALIRQILDSRGQELGTHTFSHYYCLERGQTERQFSADIDAAVATASAAGAPPRSLVFPRNQCNPAYLPALERAGIRCYRGNPESWLYRAGAGRATKGKLRRALRLLDAYINLSGSNAYRLGDCAGQQPYNFPASRFLRPYRKKWAAFDKLRVRRIKRSMSRAAAANKIFHLWWHPHNFGVDTAENLAVLADIAEHFRTLQRRYGMRSLNMGELSLLADRR